MLRREYLRRWVEAEIRMPIEKLRDDALVLFRQDGTGGIDQASAWPEQAHTALQQLELGAVEAL